MSELKTTTVMNMEFVGEMVTEKGVKVAIGQQEDGAAPYDLFLGALSACYYATFLVAAKMENLSFDKAEIVVTGEKRSSVPTTLEWTRVKLVLVNAANKDQLISAAKQAAKDCSIYQTIAKVAKMELEVEFVD